MIATLPEHARRRLPLRLRRRFPLFAVVGVLLLAGAVVAVLLLQGLERTQRGTGEGKVKPPPGTKVVSVKRTSAQDFDPLGDDDEHADQARLAVDKDPATAWTTESYSGATLAGKDGVGLYVDAAPGVAATQVEIDTPEARLGGRDPRRPRRLRARRRAGPGRRLAGGRRRQGQAQAPALQAAHQRQALPLLPRVDHEAARGRRARRDLRRLAVPPRDVALERVARALGAVAVEPVAQQPVADLRERAPAWPPTSSGSRSSPSCPGAC